MRTKTTTLYQFDELSEEAQQKALENLYDVNVNYDWWDWNYYDAKQVGVIIKGFDIGRAQSIDIEIKYSVEDTMNDILKEHDEHCETYKLARRYFIDKDALVERYGTYDANQDSYIMDEDNEYDFDHNDLEEEYTTLIGNEYLVLLREEYDYRTSEEAIKETIKCNEYEFLIDGTLA